MKRPKGFRVLLKTSVLLCCVLIFSIRFAHSQLKIKDAFNLGFEVISPKDAFPQKWFRWGQSYNITPDSLQKVSGKYSLLIQPSAARAEGHFGSPAVSIPAIYQGKVIELTGFLKLENVRDGSAGLLLRVDGKNGTLQFDNMQNRKIQGTAGWKQYSIKLPLPSNAETIFVAALHTGTGQVWVDDLELKIDGKDLLDVPIKQAKPALPADLDTAFSKGSGISLASLDRGVINNLVVLGKVWGFLKYYHPKVSSGDLNWDNELFRVLPKVLNSKNQQERNAAILSLINGMGTVKNGGTVKDSKSEDIKVHADLAWIRDSKELGEALSGRLITIEACVKPAEHYYVAEMPGVGNPEFKNERVYASMTSPDDGFRLLSLFRYWNIIQYYFPYKHLIGEDWNKVLTDFLPKFLDAKDQRSYTLVCLELVARIHDTHANVWGNRFLEENIRGGSRLPIQTKFIEDKLTVTAFYADTLGVKEKVRIGDVITKINGEPVDLLIKRFLPVTPASNYPTQLRDLAKNLLRGNSDAFSLELLRDGKVSSVTLPMVKLKALNTRIDYNPQPGKPGYYVLEENIGYVFPAKYRNTDLPHIKELFALTKGMIIDMRCYPSDFMPFTFGDYIKSKPGTFVKFTNANYKQPGTFKFTPSLRNGSLLGQKYKGKVVVIVNEDTQSQAEYTTMAFQSSDNVIVIGSTTAGADGNVSRFVLPGGISTMISGIGVYYPDGTETQRTGVKIDIPMRPTLEGIVSGRDELLEKAKELILND